MDIIRRKVVNNTIMEGITETVWGVMKGSSKDLNSLIIDFQKLSLKKKRGADAKKSKICAKIGAACPILRDIYELAQPIALCYNRTRRPQYFLNLHTFDFCHRTLDELQSESFRIWNHKTSTDKLVVGGDLIRKGGRWKVTVTNKNARGSPKWSAVVEIYGRKQSTCIIYSDLDQHDV
jgi:hypothetical protein